MCAPVVAAIPEWLNTGGWSPAEPLMRRSIQRSHGRAIYVLLEAVIYVARNGWSHVIRSGTATDWVSVPRWATPLVPVDDKAGLAALLHDELLTDRSHGLSRMQVDARFYEALRLCGVAKWRAYAMWAAVRVKARLDGDA